MILDTILTGDYYDVKSMNSFGVPARTRRIRMFSCAEELREHLASCRGEWMVLSGGNNILFTQDYPGTLLHPTNNIMDIMGETSGRVIVRAGAAVEWDDLVGMCVENGLWGIENLSYIPGYAGAAPVQNIGAYGAELADVLQSVQYYDVESGEILGLPAAECRFGYRESIFKHELKGRAIILSITLALSREPAPRLGYGDLKSEVEALGGPTLKNIREAVTAIRKRKLPEPKVLGNAGSFFRNPVVDPAKARELAEKWPGMPSWPAPGGVKLPAAWLIEKAGWKGRSLGRAGVHKDQALVLVNLGGATGSEIVALAQAVIKDVESLFGVRLSPEVNIV